MKNCVLGVRVSEQQRERLEKLAREAGMTLSQVFRVLVDNAELVSKPTVKVAVETDSRAGDVLADSSTAVAELNNNNNLVSAL
jgi:hypothetical protein